MAGADQYVDKLRAMAINLLAAVPEEDVQFRAPFTCIVAGASGTGKSTLVFKIIENYKKND